MPTTTLYADADSYIDYQNSGVNYGSGDSLYVGYVFNFYTGILRISKTTLHFDVSAIPTGVALNPVLRLRLDYTMFDEMAATLRVYRLRASFVEAEVTYLIRSTGNNWTTAGIGDSSADYFEPEDAEVTLSDWFGVSNVWVEIPLTSTLTQADIANGFKLDVYGGELGDNVIAKFWSREFSDGTYKPELRLTYSVGDVPTAVLTAVASITADSASAKQFVVTYADDTAIDYSSIATGNCTVTGPHSYSESATLVSVDVASDGTPRVATYSCPAPTGGWSWAANGTYTITLGENEVCDTSTTYVPTGTLGTFICAITGAPVVRYQAYSARTGWPKTGDGANHAIRLVYDDGTTAAPWGSPYEVDPVNMPGIYAVDLTAAQALLRFDLAGVSSTENVLIRPRFGVHGPEYTPEVDAVKLDGDATAAANLKADALSIIPGAVFDDDGTHDGSTTVIYTTLPQRGTNGYKFQFVTFGQDAAAGLRGVTRYILESADVDTYTQLTFETALGSVPANAVTLIVQGNAEAKV
jgi:hypothetical protein